MRQAACDALVTAGNCCERKTLRKFVKKGEIIVADRYYGLEHGFFGELKQIGESHAIRIRNHPRMEIAEELVPGEQDKAAGVTWQAKVKLGDRWQGEPIRVVRVEMDGKALLPASSPANAPASARWTSSECI